MDIDCLLCMQWVVCHTQALLLRWLAAIKSQSCTDCFIFHLKETTVNSWRQRGNGSWEHFHCFSRYEVALLVFNCHVLYYHLPGALSLSFQYWRDTLLTKLHFAAFESSRLASGFSSLRWHCASHWSVYYTRWKEENADFSCIGFCSHRQFFFTRRREPIKSYFWNTWSDFGKQTREFP